MDNPQDKTTAVEIHGLSVSADRDVQIASLRYFDSAGGFAAAVRKAVGRPLPEPLQALKVGSAMQGPYVILAWRSPTETLLLTDDRSAFGELERQLSAAADGCMVNQAGGICVLRVQGEKAGDLLLRLGAAIAIPNLKRPPVAPSKGYAIGRSNAVDRTQFRYGESLIFPRL
jgi:hypothetical protein